MTSSRGARAGTYLLAVTAIVLWGASFVAAKVALRSISPLGIMAGRSVLGFLTLAAFVPLQRGPADERAERGDGLRVVLLGWIGLPIHLALQSFALLHTSAVHSGWLIALNPVFTAILAALFLRERFPPLKLAGVVLGFSGALVVITGRAGAASLDVPATRGDLLILLSSLNMAVYTLLARSLMRRRQPLRTTLRAFAAGAAAGVLAYAVLGDAREIARITPEGWWALVFLGIGCTGAGYFAWSKALQRLEAGTLSTFQYVQPLVTAAIAAWWIAEPVGVQVMAGGALVLLGVSLVQRGASASS